MLAITGATGHTGRFFIKELETRQYNKPIKCLIRKPEKKQEIQSGLLDLSFVNGTLEDDESIRSLLKDADTVVHIANIHYSPKIIRIGRECGIKRFILVHTTGMYSKYKSASSGYLEIEKQIEPFLEELNITILRPTMIFGDLCDYNISKFIKFVDTFPILPIVAGGRAKVQPVNARDLAKALCDTLHHDITKGRAYNISGESAITLRELYKMIAACLEKKRIIISVPMWICVFAAKMLKFSTKGKYDLVEKVLRLDENRDYSHESATKDFGYKPEDFSIGLEREVKEYIRG